MPRELKTKEEAEALIASPAAKELRVVRTKEGAKVKVRTERQLYSFKTTSDEADSLVKGTKLDVLEYGRQSSKEEGKEKE